MGSRRAKVKRGFGEISLLPSGRFRARYTGPDGNRHSARSRSSRGSTLRVSTRANFDPFVPGGFEGGFERSSQHC